MKKLLFLPLTMLLTSCGSYWDVRLTQPFGFTAVIICFMVFGALIGFHYGRTPFTHIITGLNATASDGEIARCTLKGIVIAGILGLLIASGLFIS